MYGKTLPLMMAGISHLILPTIPNRLAPKGPLGPAPGAWRPTTWIQGPEASHHEKRWNTDAERRLTLVVSQMSGTTNGNPVIQVVDVSTLHPLCFSGLIATPSKHHLASVILDNVNLPYGKDSVSRISHPLHDMCKKSIY